MDLSQKSQVKLAPLNGVTQPRPKRSKDRQRLKGGCTNLMYACQQGLTEAIVKEVRSQVNTFTSNSFAESIILKRKYLLVN